MGKKQKTTKSLMLRVGVEQQRAEEFVIENPPEYVLAADYLKKIKGLEAEVQSAFGPIKDKQWKAYKETLGQMKRYLDPLKSAESILKNKMLEYREIEEEKRRAEEERINKEREEKAGAGKVTDQASYAPISVPSPVPKIAGQSVMRRWTAECFDLKALARAVVDGKVPPNAIQANQAVLSGTATQLKGFMEWPGVRVREIKVLAASS